MDARVRGILAECDRVQRAIEGALDRMGGGDAAPGTGGWSAGQVMWHLATVQGQVARLCEKAVAALPPMVTVPPGAPWDALVASVDRFQLPNRDHRVEAPEGVRPPEGVELFVERARWAAGRARFTDVVARCGPHLTLVRHGHPILGSLDGWQWALFVVRHEERHLRQLEELP